MLKTSFNAFSTGLKSPNNVVNENKVDGKYGDKVKNLPIFLYYKSLLEWIILSLALKIFLTSYQTYLFRY